MPESMFGNRFLFTGREWLSEAGLYDYRNRVYSAELGRFLQTDPIRFAAGDGNLYRYVRNSPSKFTDPWGLCSEETGWFDEFWEYITESPENFFNWATTALGAGAPTGMSEMVGVAGLAGPLTQALPNIINKAQNEQNLINGPDDSGQYAQINPPIGNPGTY